MAPTHFIKVNTDAAVNDRFRQASIGYVSRYRNGLAVGVFSKKKGWRSPVFAKLRGIKYGLQWALRQGYKNL